MMKPPSEFQIDRLMHAYDPVKAHEYYLRTRELKGRKPSKGTASASKNKIANPSDPRTGKTRKQIAKETRTRQRKELAAQIDKLEANLKKLEKKIREKEHEIASENRKAKAKKERAAKEADKPKTAAEKAKIARENKKYRDKNQQKLKNDAKKRDDKAGSGGGSPSKTKNDSGSEHKLSELKSLATRVRGKIVVAKQKLAAL